MAKHTIRLLVSRLSIKESSVYNLDMDNSELSHIDSRGRAKMVNVADKQDTERRAVARGSVILSPSTLDIAKSGDLKKGDLRSVSELAGVMAAKRTADLIPLCHPISIDQIDVRVGFSDDLPGVEIEATVRAKSRTGVEMEALTAVSVAALTVYDMLKAVEKGAKITNIRLVEKIGGKSGNFWAD